MKRAVTVVEGVIAFIIASVLMIGLWNLFSAAQRAGVDAERRLQAVAAVQMLGQMLERDLSQLVPDRGAEGQLVVNVDRNGRRLRLLISAYDATRPLGEGRLAFRPCTFEFDDKAHRMLRGEGGESPSKIGAMRFRDVRFALTGPADAAPDCLVVRTEWVPPEDLAANRDTLAKDTVVFDLVFGLPHLSDGERYPGWVFNPTSRAVLETRGR